MFLERFESIGSNAAVKKSRFLSDLLQQFSVDIAQNASSVCLAHLFTYQDFDEGTLGLAYVAPNKPEFAGGLCSKGKRLSFLLSSLSLSFFFKEFCRSASETAASKHGAIYLNTGLTSTKNYGKTILTKVGS